MCVKGIYRLGCCFKMWPGGDALAAGLVSGWRMGPGGDALAAGLVSGWRMGGLAGTGGRNGSDGSDAFVELGVGIEMSDTRACNAVRCRVCELEVDAGCSESVN